MILENVELIISTNRLNHVLYTSDTLFCIIKHQWYIIPVMYKLLLQNKPFLSFFLLQFLGAFNDNIYKNALVILITFHAISILGMQSQLLVTFAFGVFILPFFLFSALAGQIADSYSKASLIYYIKFCEIIIMLLALLGLYFQHYPFLLCILFLMGLQSTFFGPIKYSIIPELVQNISSDLLAPANGLIEMGTFIAILCGTLLGGLLAGSDFLVATFLPLILVLVALLGWVLCFALIDKKQKNKQELNINWNLWRESLTIISYAKANSSVFRVILLISWFWFIGASVLSQLPHWTQTILSGNETVVSILLTCFSLGVGLGSILCSQLHRLFKYSLIFKWAGVGVSVCLIVFTLDITSDYHLRLYLSYVSILLLGFFGGLFIVPLYYFVQRFSHSENLSRIIAANNIFNAFFMVLSSLFLSLFLFLGVKLPFIFVLLSFANLCIIAFLLYQDKNDKKYQQHFFDLE